MSLASRPASRWAVSARTNGEVLTAGIGRSELELMVLGIPSGFSPLEIEGWLHDLAGVAVETSRADARTRAIPALIHHALTGLLFSHAELWDKLEAPRPCSSAFVDLPDGAAFGWCGEARVHVLVDGEPVEPKWVRVRDEAGREAKAAVFAPGVDVLVTLEYWPGGEDGGVAPASLEAEWTNAAEDDGPDHEWLASAPAEQDGAATRAEVTPAWFASAAEETAGGRPSRPTAPEAAPSAGTPAQTEAPAPALFAPYHELPESLPTQQPGLSAHDFDQRQSTPSVWPSSGVPELVVPMPTRPETPGVEYASPPAGDEFESYAPEAPNTPAPADSRPASSSASPSLAAPAPFHSAPAEPAPAPVERFEAARESAAPKAAHPVARWLARVMKWGKPDRVVPEAGTEQPSVGGDAPPVSAYDALLSESVPPTPAEQSAIEFAPSPVSPPASPTARAGLRPAGLSDVLGSRAASAGSASPAWREAPAAPAAQAPASPPSGSIAINEKLQALLREIEAAESGAMPQLSPEIPADRAASPLEIDHEPVGADESFGIPPLPSALAVGPPEEDRITAIPPLPIGRVVTYPPPRPFPVAPPQPAAHAPSFEPTPGEVPQGAPSAAAAGSPPGLNVTLPGRETGAFEPIVLERTAPPEGPPQATDWAGPGSFDPSFVGPPAPAAPAEGVEPEAPFPVVTRRARSLEGPQPVATAKFGMPPHSGLWAAGIVTVFLVGWLVGGFASPGADRGGPVMAALRALGIGGAHYSVSVNSSPGGVQIEVDGKPQTSLTPATIELPPGEHVVRLVMPGLGAVEVPVKGRRGEKLSIDESLNGSLEILDTDANVPIAVSIDGKSAGYAPLRVESIAPGLHEVGFTGPGMPAWAQTVQVGVRAGAQMIARPMTAPANGVIQVQATLNDERGASPLSGAQVYVDGDLKGVTPLSVELPRGPHSLRVTWRGETAPIQVIDLPGGNQRFAAFNFGLDLDAARLTPIGNTRTFPAGQPKVVSAAVEGLAASDIHEAWLHVRTPEGLWRRYEMTLLRSGAGLVVTSVFPDNVFDKQGTTRWYLRVVSQQGDEVFSEVQRSSLASAGGTSSRSQP